MSQAANASNFLGSAAERRDAGVRAQSRSVAVVLTVTGRLGAASTGPVTQRLCQFAKLEGPLIVDLSGVDVDHGPILERLVSTLGAECHYRHVDVAVVVDTAQLFVKSALVGGNVLWADSPLEALQYFADAIRFRRNMSLWPSGDR